MIEMARKLSQQEVASVYHKILGYTVGQRVSFCPVWSSSRHRYYKCWVVKGLVNGKVQVHFGNPTNPVWVDERTLRMIHPYKKRERDE